jgi:hypothetical protein
MKCSVFMIEKAARPTVFLAISVPPQGIFRETLFGRLCEITCFIVISEEGSIIENENHSNPLECLVRGNRI